MSAALLVIDVQESFRHSAGWDETALPAYLEAQNRLIAGARAAGVPVVRVFHLDTQGPFSSASGLVRPMEGSDPYHDHRVEKHVHSALVDSGLLPWLQEHSITRLIISGIRSEQCCETTSRHGSDLGFEIDYISEATYTCARQHPNGRIFSREEILERTELALHQRFASIRTVDEVLSLVA